MIYDGVWVGEKSKVPNLNGIRKELVEEMRKIKAPVIRYPGGCFADSYDWRDAIGPVDKRPRRTNFLGRGGKVIRKSCQPQIRSQSVRDQRSSSSSAS